MGSRDWAFAAVLACAVTTIVALAYGAYNVVAVSSPCQTIAAIVMLRLPIPKRLK